MPTQIQALVTPTYDPVVEVPATGEVITEAALTDMMVAALNRTQFILENLDDLSQSPERSIIVRDDFLGFDYTSSGFGFIRTGSAVWLSTKTGNPAVAFDSHGPKNPGEFVCAVPGDGAGNSFTFYLNGVSEPVFSFENWSFFEWVCYISGPNTNLDCSLAFGLSDNTTGVPTDALRIIGALNPGSPNWVLEIIKGGSSTIIDTLEPVVSAEYITAKFAQDSVTGDIAVFINGTLRTTILFADLPNGNCTPFWRLADSTNDVAPTIGRADFFFIKAFTPTPRQGA